MKKLFDFAFCEGEIKHETVFYLVAVGKSQQDKRAWHFVQKTAHGQNFLLRPHSNEMMQFLERVYESLFPKATNYNLMRKKLVPVRWLASFLRKFPPQLLNSTRIDA